MIYTVCIWSYDGIIPVAFCNYAFIIASAWLQIIADNQPYRNGLIMCYANLQFYFRMVVEIPDFESHDLVG